MQSEGSLITFAVIAGILYAATCAAGFYVGKQRGRPILGLVLAMTLGVTGLLVLVLVPVTEVIRQQQADTLAQKRARDAWPPGWYRVPPEGTGRYRYWDGTAWTIETRDEPTQQPRVC